MAPRRPTARRAPPRSAIPSRLGFYGYSVRDVMTRPAICVPATATLEEAARRMLDAGISGLPVLGSGGRLVGVLSRKDLWRFLDADAGREVPRGILDLLLGGADGPTAEASSRARSLLRATAVRSAMSRPAISVGPSTPLDEAIGLLVARRVNRLPVVDGGKVVGIVTRHDLLTGLTQPR